MITVFLPGFSVKNKVEQKYVSSALEIAGYKIYKHEWRHWTDEEVAWDADAEAKIIFQYIEDSGENEISIIGKSIGSYVAMKILKDFPAQKTAKLIILMGIPVNDLSKEEINEYTVLNTTQVPLYVIQNNNDPHGNVNQARQILQDSNYKELIMQGDTHEYRYVTEVSRIFQDNFTETGMA